MGGGVECAAKTVLIVINTIFLICGLLLFVGGLVLKVAWEEISGLVLPLLQGSLGQSSGGLGSEILGIVGYVLIGLGLLMAVAGMLGCSGACCKIKTILIIYTCLVLLLLLTKLIFLILLITATLDDTFKDQIREIIDNKYTGIADTSTEGLALNLIMVKYSCCGLDNWKDFKTALNWDRKYQTTYEGTLLNITLGAPVTCCKTIGDFPDITLVTQNCTWHPNKSNSNRRYGCWDPIKEEVNSYKTILLAAYAAVLAIEAICAAVAIFLIIRTIKDEKDGKINPMLD